MDNFYLIDDHGDREWVVPSGALGHGRLVDVLDRKGIFPTKTYVACQCASEGGVTICEAIPTPGLRPWRRRRASSRTSRRRRPISRSGARRRKPRGTLKPPRNLFNGAARRVSSSHFPPLSTIAPRT